MRLRLVSGIALLGWQIVVGAIALTGQAETILGATDPSWWATFWAIVVAPPLWLIGIALAMAVGLIISSRRRVDYTDSL